MAFVKLDCGILNSTLWFDKGARDIFITALLMAEPFELTEPASQIHVGSLEYTGWTVPVGWYGFVPAAGIGIIHRAGVDETVGHAALMSLGSPELSSRTPKYDGRRLVRIDGGYLVLNFIKYRERDATAADRQRRWRERQKADNSSRVMDDPLRVISNQAEAEYRVQSTEVQEEQEVVNDGLRPSSLMSLWNDLTQPPIPKCLKLSKARVQKAKVRLAEHDLGWWREVVIRINASDFCRGQSDRGWVATFDWLVANEDSALKVLEGKYDNRTSAPKALARATASPLPPSDDDWCQHEPRCNSREWHALLVGES